MAEPLDTLGRCKTWRSALTPSWDLIGVFLLLLGGAQTAYLAAMYVGGATDRGRDLLFSAGATLTVVGILAVRRRPGWLHVTAAALAAICFGAHLVMVLLA